MPYSPVLRRRILVATPDHALRKLIASVLRCDGIDAIEAADTEGALVELMRARGGSWGRPVDVVVLDARRDPDLALRTGDAVRRLDPLVGLLVLIRGRERELPLESVRATPLPTPLTATSLRSAIASLAPWLGERVAV